MKKSIAVALLLCFMAAPVFAAEGIVWSYKPVFGENGKKWVEITAVITTAADGSLTATQLGGTAGGDGTPYDVRGKYLYQIKTYYGVTAVTADSDLVLNPGTATSYDILNGAGANMIDDNTNKSFKPYINAAPATVPVFSHPYIDITGNIVDSAIHTVILQFIQ